MEKIILIGHGSPRKEANNVEIMAALLHRAIHPDCQDQCVKAAYMQFAQPDIAATIAACVEEGAERIVVHPFFLYCRRARDQGHTGGNRGGRKEIPRG